MILEERNDVGSDQFPLGMRVLAVDDNPTCLMVLENLLRKCQYNVTTTNQAVHALHLLRENKNQFDLIISDVDMPDMDGFKLLELVGLEMDLPVIMLSAYGDTNLVMKGITHGACDYLLKPVRIEELKNIWQHVLRRKQFDNKEQKISEKSDLQSGETGRGSSRKGNTSRSGKTTRKRKDQHDDDDDENEENAERNEDPLAQKKPRVVWSVELHQKFVAAVNHLGIDKAVPKRILELMNVENLTRENVASHLQKYRIYLRRLNSMAPQQANFPHCYFGVNSPSNIPFNIPSRLRMSSFAPNSMTSEIDFQQPLQPRNINQDFDILEGRPMPLVQNHLGVNLNPIVYPIGVSDNSITNQLPLTTFPLSSDSFPNLLKAKEGNQSSLLGVNPLEEPMASNVLYPLSSVCAQEHDNGTEMRCPTTIADSIQGVKMNFNNESANVPNLVWSSANSFLPPDHGQRQHGFWQDGIIGGFSEFDA